MTLSPRHIPLSLYIHLPWCVRKCPYCDFNSHAKQGLLPEADYVAALCRDLASETNLTSGRTVHSIFFGGGTPSLFSADSIASILDNCRTLLPLSSDCEITLEANPGTVEQDRFFGYRRAGVNRLSIGIQSLNPQQLQRLGRIHGQREAIHAAQAARDAGFDNFNLDLMYALPDQSLAEAGDDLSQLIALRPTHISYYQLTLEPGTPFHHQPPALPDDDLAWAMQEQGEALLAAAGFAQYEVSAYAQPNRRCRHNLNYWQFGDYLGIGAGAHGKLTQADGRILRTAKRKYPQAYQQTAGTSAQYDSQTAVAHADLPFEYLLNTLRLNEGFDPAEFSARCGLELSALQPSLSRQIQRGLLTQTQDQISATPRGRQLLNTVLAEFLPKRA